jgi:hypothetical protein
MTNQERIIVMSNNSLELLKETKTISKPDNPWLEVSNELGSFGKILKFNKGLWEVGDDEIAEGTQYVVLIDQVAREWVKFEDSAPTKRLRFPIADGVPPPPREQLGDTDKSKWEVDDDGKPRDPWTLQWQLGMVPVGALGDLVVFTTSSKGGESCIVNLCGIYGRSPRNGMLPIVALKTRSYKRKTYGKIQTPDLLIVGWDTGGAPSIPPVPSAPIAAANADAEVIEMDDEIPF